MVLYYCYYSLAKRLISTDMTLQPFFSFRMRAAALFEANVRNPLFALLDYAAYNEVYIVSVHEAQVVASSNGTAPISTAHFFCYISIAQFLWISVERTLSDWQKKKANFVRRGSSAAARVEKKTCRKRINAVGNTKQR